MESFVLRLWGSYSSVSTTDHLGFKQANECIHFLFHVWRWQGSGKIRGDLKLGWWPSPPQTLARHRLPREQDMFWEAGWTTALYVHRFILLVAWVRLCIGWLVSAFLESVYQGARKKDFKACVFHDSKGNGCEWLWPHFSGVDEYMAMPVLSLRPAAESCQPKICFRWGQKGPWVPQWRTTHSFGFKKMDMRLSGWHGEPPSPQPGINMQPNAEKESLSYTGLLLLLHCFLWCMELLCVSEKRICSVKDCCCEASTSSNTKGKKRAMTLGLQKKQPQRGYRGRTLHWGSDVWRDLTTVVAGTTSLFVLSELNRSGASVATLWDLLLNTLLILY